MQTTADFDSPFIGQVRAGRRFTSFTALYERREAESPDYDAEPERGRDETEERFIFTFPRGARTGRCLLPGWVALASGWLLRWFHSSQKQTEVDIATPLT